MSRPVIYQLFVRHFSNHTSEHTLDGTREQNGCGTFPGITTKALQEIQAMGFTHVWLTGVIEHASGTAYATRPAHPEQLIKGRAGSPYAITDYFDVSPDLADDPGQRICEFQALLTRAQEAGLRVLIDFVPNHVARCYESDVVPEFDFGWGDDPSQFYARENAYYYLEGEGALELPDGRGEYLPERNRGRVTGNNSVTWEPSAHDWFETVKLNYGYDFRQGHTLRELPGKKAPISVVPRTWQTMLEVVRYWAAMGVDGVRCDMAHMVPVPFWDWLTEQIGQEFPDFYWSAEGYAQDPMGCLPNRTLHDLKQAGIDHYYDQEFYHALKSVVEGESSVSRLDYVFFDQQAQTDGLRYLENHDEVRSANKGHFGTDRQNLAASAVAWLTGKGGVMLYNGQEVGELAAGASGYSGDDARSSIFDYIHLPELQKWTNQGQFDGAGLSDEQSRLRASYAELLQLVNGAPFSQGAWHGLNYANPGLEGAQTFSFLRYTAGNYGYLSLVVASLGSECPEQVEITIPASCLDQIGRESGEHTALSQIGCGSVKGRVTAERGLQFTIPIDRGYGVYRLIRS